MKARGETIRETLRTPVVKSYEVIVAGGGPAGCVAALAAARQGAKTLLVERAGYLGGMLTGGMVGSSGIYTVAPGTMKVYTEIRRRLAKRPDSVQLIRGIPREIMRRLISIGGGIGYDGEVPAYVAVHVPTLKMMLVEMMEEAGVELLLYGPVVGPILDGKRVSGVIVEGKGGREGIRAKVVVDATGDGDVAARAGAAFEHGRKQDQEAINMTVMFTMGGIDMEKFIREEMEREPENPAGEAWPPVPRAELIRGLRKGNAYWFGTAGELSKRPSVPAALRDEIDRFTWSTNKTRGHIFACNSPIKDELFINVTEVFKKTGTSSWDLTEATRIGYKEIQLLARMYKAGVAGFEKAYIREIAPMMGVRETRRITGDYVLTGEDVRVGRKFPDGVAGSSHPIDTSEDNQGRFEKLHGGAYFEVPYRSLLVAGFDGIVTAGRCISTDHDAIGSIRCTGSCMSIGQASGTAAALAAKSEVEPRDLDGKEVRAECGWVDVALADLGDIDEERDETGTVQRQ
ncbi:MAG: FAD-dependent oxidoreductase [Planctomycetota bacterium]